MLNFDDDRYLRIQSGAVGLAGRIHQEVDRALREGVQNLFFVGSGGAGILMEPAARLLQEGSTFPVHQVMPAELVVRGSVHLGPHSLVVMPSLSGTTRESIEALRWCRERGARVITLTGFAGVPLADEASWLEKLRRADAPVSAAETQLRYLPCGLDRGNDPFAHAQTTTRAASIRTTPAGRSRK